MEKLGLVILKDENGKYVARGNRNIKINGENIKPLLASAVEALPNVTILNRVAITDYLVKENRIYGAVGFSIENETAVEIRAKKVLCATGGASGLYRPNNPGFSRHKMWYPPFNTGAGYAKGIYLFCSHTLCNGSCWCDGIFTTQCNKTHFKGGHLCSRLNSHGITGSGIKWWTYRQWLLG